MKRTLAILATTAVTLLLLSPRDVSSQGFSLFEGDPNDLGQPFDAIGPTATRVEDVPGAVTPQILADFRARAVVDVVHDTGLVGSGVLFRPSTIVLDGTPEARGRGVSRVFGNGSSLGFGIGSSNLPGGPRGIAELDFVGGFADPGSAAGLDGVGFAGSNVRFLRAFGVINPTPNAELRGGQDWTTFGDSMARPFSVITDGTPAGAVFRRQGLLRYTVFHANGFSHAIAIEDPTNADFVVPDPSTPADPDHDIRLRRWPDLVANVRWVRPGDTSKIDRAQVAVLIREIGYEDVAGAEHFVTGWGFAGTARFRVVGDSNIQLGLVGGEGLGRYLFGFGADSSARDVTAAGPDVGGRMTALPTVGGYIGYQQYWCPRFVTNVAYGYAHADTTAAMPGEVARRTENAWANAVVELKENFFLGLEYHYGILEVNDGRWGNNHRIQLTFAYRIPK